MEAAWDGALGAVSNRDKGLAYSRRCWGTSFASVSASPAATSRTAQARPAGTLNQLGGRHDGRRTRAESAWPGLGTRMAFTLPVIEETSDLLCNEELGSCCSISRIPGRRH